MTRAFYGHELRLRGNQLQSLLDLRDRAERIARALDEESGSVQVEEVLRAKLVRLAGRVQRIRKQEQSGGFFGRFGAEHAGLPSAVRVAADEHPAGCMI